ncbi:hypothetical protein OFM36_32095, partial [Escherichia coli]|nr:hypothetical protein [Escherichia coli]
IVLTDRELGIAGLLLFAVPVGALWLAEKQYLDRTRKSVAELRRSHAELEETNRHLRALLDENRELVARIQRSYLSTITSLARTIEAKDPYTG